MSCTDSYGKYERTGFWTSPRAPLTLPPVPIPALATSHLSAHLLFRFWLTTPYLTPEQKILLVRKFTSGTGFFLSLSLCRLLSGRGLSGLAFLLPLEGGWLELQGRM